MANPQWQFCKSQGAGSSSNATTDGQRPDGASPAGYPWRCPPTSQGSSLQVNVATGCRCPHFYHQQEPSGLLWWTSYFILQHQGPPFCRLLSSTQINNLPPISPSPLVLVLLQPHLTAEFLMPLPRQSQPYMALPAGIATAGSLAPTTPPGLSHWV